MVNTAFVNIWGQRAGAIVWNENSRLASFEYDPQFIRTGIELSPIKMPLRANSIYSFPELQQRDNPALDTFKGLPGLLSDSLPDRYGNQLINLWLARNGRPQNSMNPVEQLCFIGKRGMGALEFEPAKPESEEKVFNIELESLIEVAHKVLNERGHFKAQLSKDSYKAMTDILKIGTSAGGARPKALIAFNEQSGEVKSGQAAAPKNFEHWLLKMDGVSDAQFGETLGYGRVEMAYYHMALACGIEMMPSRLLEENGRAHFMTRRFDREGSTIKHHIQTFCGIQHADFNQVDSFSYEQLFQTMRILKLTYPEAEQMYKRMVFNILARNCDDHTKNFAFRLKKGGKWELAPAYDVCYAYRPDSIWVSRHALSVNGKRENIDRDDLLTLAETVNVKQADSIITELSNVIKNWGDFAGMTKVNSKLSQKIEKNLIRLK